MKKYIFGILACLAIFVIATMYLHKKPTEPVKSKELALKKSKDSAFMVEQARLNFLDSVYSKQQERFIFKLLQTHSNTKKGYKANDSVQFFYEKDTAKFMYIINMEPFFEKNVQKAHIVWFGRNTIEKMQLLYECHNQNWTEIYADNRYNCIKFADVNGDKYPDVLIRHYPVCGHSMHNWVEVLLYNPVKKRVKYANDGEGHDSYLSNPTFYPKKGIALCNETCNLEMTNNVYQVKFKNYKWHLVENIHLPSNLPSYDNKYHRCSGFSNNCADCPVIRGLPRIYKNLEVFEDDDSTFFKIK